MEIDVARITASNSFGVDLRNIEFYYLYFGEFYVATSTQYKITYSNGWSDYFRGSGFQYNELGEPIAGTVKSYSVLEGGSVRLEISGISLAATDIVEAAQTFGGADDYGLISSALRGNDIVSLSGGNDLISTFAGADSVNGGSGDDTLYGGGGDDTLIGGSGADTLYGEAGFDTASYASAGSAVKVFMSRPADNRGHAAGDAFSSIESVAGSRFSDVIAGNGSGNTLLGAGGHDTLSGGGGNDRLFGDAGDDRLSGDVGADTLTGGTGRDHFIYRALSDSPAGAQDLITDFKRGDDDIDLLLVDAKAGTGGDQAFKLIGSAGFHKLEGELRTWTVDKSGTANDRTYVAADTNGDGKADLQITLNGLHALKSGDFLL